MVLELWSSAIHGVIAGVDSCNYNVYLLFFAKLARLLVSNLEYLGLASVLKIDIIDRWKNEKYLVFFLSL